ncbi:MAG: hypothetical protein KAH25_02920 [Bacteroidales bacterium]|nr:hypothetical protein [Bacteroidales bacterium]
MKNFKLLIVLFLGLSISFVSCTKKTEQEVLDDILNVKGSVSITAAGNTYDKLFTSVVFSVEEQMVTFWAYELDSDDSFLMSFGEVPAVGETKVIDMDDEDSIALIITGSFMGSGGYYATSGSIKRVSTDKYEVDVVLADYMGTATDIALSGTVTVGVNQ